MNNIDAETGVRYGVISANSLHPEVVGEMMYGDNSTNFSREEFEEELQSRLNLDTDAGQDEYDEELEFWECDEPHIEGSMDEVHFATCWLGGALNFFILKSEVITNCNLCSPCVPGAGNLNDKAEEGFKTYDVPKIWKEEY